MRHSTFSFIAAILVMGAITHCAPSAEDHKAAIRKRATELSALISSAGDPAANEEQFLKNVASYIEPSVAREARAQQYWKGMAGVRSGLRKNDEKEEIREVVLNEKMDMAVVHWVVVSGNGSINKVTADWKLVDGQWCRALEAHR